MVAEQGVTSPDDVLGWLLEQSHTLPPGRIDAVVPEALGRLGARASCLYLTDHDQLWLHPFGTRRPDHASQSVSGTMAGRSFALQDQLAVRIGDSTRVWVRDS